MDIGIGAYIPKNLLFAILVAFFAQAPFIACNQTTREDLLSGNFGNVDRSPPKPITPDDFKVKSTSSILSWSASAGASRYTVDIAQDAAFSQSMPGSPFVTNEASLEVAFADANTYFWRVRANTTEAGRFSDIRKIHVLGGAMRVFCPSTTASCSNAGRYGTKNFPYEVIQESIPEAKAAGVELLVASRGSGAFYGETLTLLSGVSLRGGYSAANWSRDIDANITEIRFSASRLISATYLVAPTLTLEGFYLNNINSGINYVIYIEGTSYLSVENNRLKPGTGSGGGSMSYGLYCVTGSPNIRNNTVFAGTALSGNTAIFLGSNSAPVISGNRLVGGSASSYGIQALSSGATVVNNYILGGSGSLARSFEDTTGGAKALLALNYVHAGYGTGTSYGILSGTGQQRIYANTIDAGNAATAYGVQVSTAASSNPIIDANLIYHSGGGTSVYGVFEASALQSPLHLRRNLFMTANGLKAYWDNNATDFPTICSVDGRPATTDTSCSGTNVHAAGGSTIGNLTASTFASVFSSFPIGMTYTADGPDVGSTYDGSTSRFEIPTQAGCNSFNVGDNFSYFFDSPLRQITARDCSASTSFLDFSPVLVYDFLRFVPIINWGAGTPSAAERYALKTGSPAINTGFACNEFVSATHTWGTGSSQADCDAKFPHANSTHNAGNCQTTFLYPAIQIDPNATGSGPFNIPASGNGLCEAGETCLYNPNIGAYAGHGNLIVSGCDLSSVAGGAFTTVNLLKYANNGY